MRIDDEGLDADRAQMIERESDQRLPVNWYQRLGK